MVNVVGMGDLNTCYYYEKKNLDNHPLNCLNLNVIPPMKPEAAVAAANRPSDQEIVNQVR
jgi:hypothetical protein